MKTIKKHSTLLFSLIFLLFVMLLFVLIPIPAQAQTSIVSPVGQQIAFNVSFADDFATSKAITYMIKEQFWRLLKGLNE